MADYTMQKDRNDYVAIKQGRIFRAMENGATGIFVTFKPKYEKTERPAMFEKYVIETY